MLKSISHLLPFQPAGCTMKTVLTAGLREKSSYNPTSGIISVFIISVSVLLSGCEMKKAPARVGFAQQEINSIGLTGPDYSFRDTLYAKVVWVEDGDQSFGIVSLDMIEVTDTQTADIKQGIADSLGLAGARITVCPSHTHSGLEVESRALAQRVGSIARKARQAARPALAGYSRVEAGPGLVVNRRIAINDQFGDLTMVYCINNRIVEDGRKMDVRGQVIDFILHGAQILGSEYANSGVTDSSGMTNASAQSIALLNSLPPSMILDGPVDPHLEALCFKDESGKVIGTLLRFACHATSYRGSRTKQYSADYPGVLCREVSKATGGAPAQFLQGPCGNTKPFIEDYGEKPMVDLGTRLGELITGQMGKAEFEPLTRVCWQQEVQSFAVSPEMIGVTEETRIKSEEDFKKMAASPFDPYELKKVHEKAIRSWASQFAGSSDSLSLPFTVIGFNRVAMVCLPGEIFAEHSLAIKDRFPGERIMVVELADTGSPWYVPTRDAFPRGGYGPNNASLPAGAGERMVEICTRLLQGFYL